MSKWNGRTDIDDARALFESVSREGCWCLRCMAENATGGEGTDLIKFIGFDPNMVGCQAPEHPSTESVLVKVAEAIRCAP